MAIGAASNYQNTTRSMDSINQTKKTDKTKGKKQSLSPQAEAYLKELKKKYSNMDFSVASYDTEEEAQEYLSNRNSSKEYNVLIDPEMLEKMAKDSKVAAKYEGILSNAGAEIDNMKEQLGEDADKVKSFSISVDKDGVVSYFAEMEKTTAKNNEERNQSIDKAKESKKKEAQKTETKQLKAESAEKLVELIKKELAESKMLTVRTEEEKALGSFIDFKM